MAANPPGSGTGSTVYTQTTQTTQATSVASPTTRVDQVATYIYDDLKDFVKQMNINLAEYLRVSAHSGVSQDTDELLELLYMDIKHLLDQQLITGVHLLLTEPEPDPNSQAYLLRYHARYVITLPDAQQQAPAARSILPQGQGQQTQPVVQGGRLDPPDSALLREARFAMLVDWHPSATQQRMHELRRPNYNFDWVPERSRFDASNLIDYRPGTLHDAGGTQMTDRNELNAPGI